MRLPPEVPYAILLVPYEVGAPLLAPGPCGAQPPRARLFDHGGADLGRRRAKAAVFALPLWWAGVRVPEGIDRVRRVIAAQGWSARDALPSSAWCMEPNAAGAILLAREAEARGLCHVVVLDLVGGRLVQRVDAA